MELHTHKNNNNTTLDKIAKLSKNINQQMWYI